jgi:hypothetical protein
LAVVEATVSSLPALPDLQTRESEAIKDGFERYGLIASVDNFSSKQVKHD